MVSLGLLWLQVNTLDLRVLHLGLPSLKFHTTDRYLQARILVDKKTSLEMMISGL